MDDKRIEWLDTAKGFAVLCVVIAHVTNMYIDHGYFSNRRDMLITISNLMNSFMMPLFFCLSGCSFGVAYTRHFFEQENVALKIEKIKRQVINLIAIYFLWSISYNVLKIIFKTEVLVASGWTDILWIPLKASSLFWYLYVLIVCYVVTVLCAKWGGRRLLLLSVVLCLLQYWITFGELEEYTVTKASMYLVFFIFGIYCVRDMEVHIIQAGVSAIICIVGYIVAGVVRDRLGMEARFIWSDLPVIGGILSLGICWGIINLFKMIKKVKIFQQISIYALEIYLLHRYAMAIVRKGLDVVGVSNAGIALSVCVCLTMMVCIGITMLLKKVGVYNFLFHPARYYYADSTK